MNDKLITAAQEEARRLLREQREFLLTLQRADGLLRTRGKDGKPRVLDKERVVEIVEVLDSEASKIERLEITLAVAGTVKAGKSTAINAIVGTEVLPNRARPMTALPTVIRHRGDLLEPQLTVNNDAALDRMAKEIEKKLQDGKRLEQVRKSHDVDMKDLLDDLVAGRAPMFGGRHHGRDAAFETLFQINDLLRLGRHEAVGVELPMEEYDELDEMPSLDVRFRCLVDAAPDTGALALLDLPGFNEARMSEHLTEVLEEQLEKASAVLVILDFTQLNTEASEELEVLIDKVSTIMAEQIFVLVNKFDQCSANDTYSDTDILRNHIADDTMRGQVEPRQVYPVCARHAYLASRALEELDRHGKLPSPEDEAWVSDFIKEAFGPRDRKTGPSNPDLTKEAAEDLWSISEFNAPLENVVVAAQNHATTLALKSALRKLQAFGTKIENHLNLSIGSLTEDIVKLQDVIGRMSQKTQHIKSFKDLLDKTTKTARQEAINKVNEELGGEIIRMENDIEMAFDEQLNKVASQGEEKKKHLQLLSDFREKGMLDYTDEMKYENARLLIRSVYSDMARQLLDNAISSVRTVIRSEITKMKQGVASLNEMLDEIRGDLSDAGIEVSFSIPNVALDSESIEAPDVRLSRVVKTRLGSPHTVVTHGLANFLDPFNAFGWGKTEVRNKQTYYVIDRKAIIAELKKALEATSIGLRNEVKRQLEEWRGKCDGELNSAKEQVDACLQVLLDGIAAQKDAKIDTQKDAQRRAQELVESAKQLQKRSGHMRAEAKAFQEAVETLDPLREAGTRVQMAGG